MQHQLLVCTTCASKWQNNQLVDTPGGTLLFEYLQAQQLQAFSVEPVRCMSACSHACVVALAHPDKHTYLFGNLPHSPEALPSVYDALADCTGKYLKHANGMVGWSDRPDLLKNAVIARIPPLPIAS